MPNHCAVDVTEQLGKYQNEYCIPIYSSNTASNFLPYDLMITFVTSKEDEEKTTGHGYKILHDVNLM